MPKSEAKNTGGKARLARKERLDRSSLTLDHSNPTSTESTAQTSTLGLLSEGYDHNTFHHHAAILGDPRMSQPMYARQKAQLVRHLQRSYGNGYVQRLVEHIMKSQAEVNASQHSVQASLTVGAAGDKYEKEADRVAKRVMGMDSHPDQPSAPGHENLGENETPTTQRAVQWEDQPEEEEVRITRHEQGQIGMDGGDVAVDMEQSINSARGTGQALPDNLRSSMETAFGAEFSGVKVHTGPESDAMNRNISARAFTAGQDIFFRAGEFNPRNSSGRETLAHELTHVVQQGGGRIKRLRPLNPNLIQLRGENPHAQSDAHEGWNLTGHHIVAHSELVKALAKLDDESKAEVLRYSIPDTLTKSMLDNMKVAIDDSDDARAALRARLVSTAPEDSDDKEEAGIQLGDIRNSLFEWQGGNQFSGPNTSIRAEPTSSKDDTDFDAKYFTSLSEEDFQALTDLGAKLDEVEEEENIADNLKAMLDITKNVTPDPFDASKWTEITSLEKLLALQGNEDLDREHLLDYSFFKLKQNEIGEGKTYEKITSGIGGEFFYEGLKIPLKAKSTFGYISVVASQKITPSNEIAEKLKAALDRLGVVTELEGKMYKITVDGNITVEGKTFQISGYDAKIPCSAEAEGKITSPQGLIDNRLMKTVTMGKSLYKYCKDSGMPTSSFLPKQLYDSLQ